MIYLDTTKTPNRVIARPNWRMDSGEPVTDAYLAEQGIYRIVDDVPEGTEFVRYERGPYDIVDGKAVYTYTAVSRDLDAVKNLLRGKVTAKRYQVETKGVTINGTLIESSRESQAMISGAVLYAKENPYGSVDFKAASGWVTIPSSDMVGIGKAVANHVQECFRYERSLHETIDAAGDLLALESIDIESGWPGA